MIFLKHRFLVIVNYYELNNYKMIQKMTYTHEHKGIRSIVYYRCDSIYFPEDSAEDTAGLILSPFPTTSPSLEDSGQ